MSLFNKLNMSVLFCITSFILSGSIRKYDSVWFYLCGFPLHLLGFNNIWKMSKRTHGHRCNSCSFFQHHGEFREDAAV